MPPFRTPEAGTDRPGDATSVIRSNEMGNEKMAAASRSGRRRSCDGNAKRRPLAAEAAGLATALLLALLRPGTVSAGGGGGGTAGNGGPAQNESAGDVGAAEKFAGGASDPLLSRLGFDHPRELHAARETASPPVRRSDLDPTEPVHPGRYVDYGGVHPFDEAAEEGRNPRVDERGRRELQKQGVVKERPTDGSTASAGGVGVGGEVNQEGVTSTGGATSSAGAGSGGRHRPLRIHFDSTELESWSALSSSSSRRVRYLTRKVLPAMAQMWSSALSVVPVRAPLRIDRAWCPFSSPDAPSFRDGARGADLVVYVTANGDACEGGGGVLASAFSCYWDQYERPVAGNIDFCLDTIEVSHLDELGRPEKDDPDASAGPATQQTSGGGSSTEETEVGERRHDKLLKMAVGTAVHEFAHVLGVTSADLLYFYDWRTGLPRTPDPVKREVPCVSPPDSGTDPDAVVMEEHWMPDETTLSMGTTARGARYYEITTPTVRRVVRNQFGCPSATGARLENQPTNGDCFGSHFDERHYFTENMSPVLGGVPEVLSSLTLALLHDSGWYVPDYSIARVSPFGHGAGCDFLEKDCVVNGVVPEYGKGYFCDVKYGFDTQGRFAGGYGCDPTHTHIGICDLVDYNELKVRYDPPGKAYQYFPKGKETWGALMHTADFCPTYSIDALSCQDRPPASASTSSGRKFPDLPDDAARRAESYGRSSKCFDTRGADRPVCLDAACDASERVVKVRLGGGANEEEELITCRYDGQVHPLPGSAASFVCPRLSQVCPDIICPANCAGMGDCDYSLVNPECVCDDPRDASGGCYEGAGRGSVPPAETWRGGPGGATSGTGVDKAGRRRQWGAWTAMAAAFLAATLWHG